MGLLLPGPVSVLYGLHRRHEQRLDRRLGDRHGRAPSGTSVSATATACVVHRHASPALTIVKSASPNILTAAGQTITYTFLVTNTGNVTLSDVNVTDHPTTPAGGLTTGPTCQGLSNPTATCSGNSITLTPGQQASFTGTYVVTQTDFDHELVVDGHRAGGGPPSCRFAGHGHVEHGDSDGKPGSRDRDLEVGQPEHGHGSGPDRHLHVHGQEHRQRRSDGRRCAETVRPRLRVA